jgi:hypothetical protein
LTIWPSFELRRRNRKSSISRRQSHTVHSAPRVQARSGNCSKSTRSQVGRIPRQQVQPSAPFDDPMHQDQHSVSARYSAKQRQCNSTFSAHPRDLHSTWKDSTWKNGSNSASQVLLTRCILGHTPVAPHIVPSLQLFHLASCLARSHPGIRRQRRRKRAICAFYEAARD